MKFFTNLAVKVKAHPKFQFGIYIAVFYVLLMAVYFYLMYANLSTAPDFVYNQF